MTATPGLRGTARTIVTDADTAQALGSGDVPVLGTPRLLAMVEAAALDAVRDHLDPGSTSVGSTVQLDHLAPTPVGAWVEAEAVLQQVDGRMLQFDIRAWGSRGDVARGSHRRVVVDRDRFVVRATRSD